MQNIKATEQHKTVKIIVEGPLVSGNVNFVSTIKTFPSSHHFIVDLTSAETIDSSGLGLLMILREYTTNSNKIRIVGSQPSIIQIFQMAKFNDFFDIDGY